VPQIAVIFASLGFRSCLNFRRAIISWVLGIYLYISGLYLCCDVIYQHLTSLLFEFKVKLVYITEMDKSRPTTIADWFVDANNWFTLCCGCVYSNTIVSTWRLKFCTVCRDSPAIFEVILPRKIYSLSYVHIFLLLYVAVCDREVVCMQYVRRAMSNSEKLEFIVVTKRHVLGCRSFEFFYLS